MKKAFSMIEVIFVVLLISIIATIAIPKFGNITTQAKISAIKQDINTIITSIQNYVAINGNINSISDATNLDTTVWNVSDTEAIFKDGDYDCITITLNNDNLEISVNTENTNSICNQLSQSISDQTIQLQ
jgi:general secretion pathway protein G